MREMRILQPLLLPCAGLAGVLFAGAIQRYNRAVMGCIAVGLWRLEKM